MFAWRLADRKFANFTGRDIQGVPMDITQKSRSGSSLKRLAVHPD
jgi:hypothetical protein